MNWIEILLVTSALIGFMSMGVLVARSPSFWISLGVAGVKAAIPFFIKILKPASLEEQKKFQDAVARGEEYPPRGVQKRKSK